jgi:hypothetical protein
MHYRAWRLTFHVTLGEGGAMPAPSRGFFAEKEDGLIISEDLDPAGVDHVILTVGVFLPEPPHIPDQVPIIE